MSKIFSNFLKKTTKEQKSKADDLIYEYQTAIND